MSSHTMSQIDSKQYDITPKVRAVYPPPHLWIGQECSRVLFNPAVVLKCATNINNTQQPRQESPRVLRCCKEVPWMMAKELESSQGTTRRAS